MIAMNTRTKGQILEKHVCEQIRKKGLDDHVRPAFNSGATNTEKADIWTSLMINGQNAGIECKNHKTVHLIDWWEQTRKLEKLGREPMLVYKIHNAPLGDTICTMYLDSVLELLKENMVLRNKYERKLG